MKFWLEQFFDNVYRLSVTIGFIIMLGIGIWFLFFFLRKITESEAKEQQKQQNNSD